MEKADELLAEPPRIEQIDVLAAKLPGLRLNQTGVTATTGESGRDVSPPPPPPAPPPPPPSRFGTRNSGRGCSR